MEHLLCPFDICQMSLSGLMLIAYFKTVFFDPASQCNLICTSTGILVRKRVERNDRDGHEQVTEKVNFQMVNCHIMCDDFHHTVVFAGRNL
jgi:hypothetical protein